MQKVEMKKMIAPWIRRHVTTILIIGGGVLLTSAGLGWYSVTTNRSIEQQENATQTSIAEMNKRIATVKQQKAAEKAAQEAAARQAAEQSRTAGDAGATSIDAKACNTSGSHNNPAAIDVLVNKKHCLQPLTFAPNDLVTSHSATLSAKAVAAFNEMYAAAAAAGQPFSVTSSYRSYSNQVSTYNYWVSVSGQAGADTYSARPGYSEHQTGLTIDVAAGSCALDCFGSTPQYQWFQQHAADFGFIQRYYAGSEAITGYKAEEWHYRYVGVDVAKDMKTKGIKTLEQYWNMPGGTY